MSGVKMDIIRLLKNLLSNESVEALVPILELLRDNGFDLKRTINNISPEKLAPVIEKLFLKNTYGGNGFTAEAKTGGVTPIAQVADSEIVYALNRYIGASS